MFDILFKKRVPRFPATTDIHCHIVPGIDDGSPDIEHSMELLGQMSSWGIKRIIPTPHHTEEVFPNNPATIDGPFQRLVDASLKEGIDIQLLQPSGEYRIDNYLRRLLDDKMVRPLPGNYLLVENSFSQAPWDIDEFLFDLTIKGYNPILAHPERYIYYHSRDLHNYRNLHARGLKFQVNILSFAGYYGHAIKKTAEAMLDNDMVDFIGTDLHHMRHADAISKYLTSSQGAQIVKKISPRLLNDTI